jgi:hypothetical protein
MALHQMGWQVHRSYIDEGIDFVITKYWCIECGKFTSQYIKQATYNNKIKKCVTNLCKFCRTANIKIISRYLQVKTSEGVLGSNAQERKFSFHPKIRYDMGKDVFYVWIAVFMDEKGLYMHDVKSPIIHFYIFNTKDVSKFDNLELPTYQITDNQKTTLNINIDGRIKNKGKIYTYDYFKEFHNNFQVLDEFNT